MSKLQELDLEIEYDSEEDDVVNSFFVPVLSAGTSYKRLAGYFSSQALAIVGRGIKELLKNGGTMQLVCGHQFTQKDKEALESGGEAKDLSTDFINKLDELSDDDFRKQHVQIMGLMIANKKLEIKIADVPAGSGIFHQKIGIISDGSDTISFVGSINETANALLENTENFDVHKSWTQGGTDAERVERHEGRFDKYWADKGTSTKVYSLPEAIEKKLLQIAKDVEIKYQARQPTPRNNLWGHQEEAITAWIDNGHRGIWNIATGGGKTYTAIRAAEGGITFRDGTTMEKTPKSVITVVTIPKRVLQKQWVDEINANVRPKPRIIRVGSGTYGDPGWDEDLKTVLDARSMQSQTQKNELTERVYVVAIAASATDEEKFLQMWSNTNPDDVQLICDEVHNMGTEGGQRIFTLPCARRMGLSATADRQWDPAGTQAIMNFFGGIIYNYTIEQGITDGHLCHYEVHHYDIELTETEYADCRRLTGEIGKIYHMIEKARANREWDTVRGLEQRDKQLKGERADVIKSAENKIPAFEQFVQQLQHEEKTIVFCTDRPQLQECSDILDNHSKKFRKYHASVDLEAGKGFTPEQLQNALDDFEEGNARLLVGIGCLNEGVDIKSCTACVLISSSGTEREFIQRRGRMLRQLGTDKIAHLYDFVAYPPREIGGNAWTAKQLEDDDTTISWILRHELARSEIIWEAANPLGAITQAETHMGQRFGDFRKTLTQIRNSIRSP